MKFIKKKIKDILQWKKHLSLKRKILGIVIILIIAGITYKRIQGNKPKYTFDTITSQTITEIVTETGNVSTAGEYDIPSPSTGILSEIYVQNGGSVISGQKLFKVTSTATPQQKAIAWAAYAAAKSTLDSTNAALFSLQSTMFKNWETYTNLAKNSTYQNADGSPNNSNRVVPEFATAQDNWFAAEANYKNQQSVIAGAQAAATNTYLAYQATQNSIVTAPMAGTIHNLSGVVGSIVTATPSPVCILATDQSYSIKATVNEVDINKIKTGDSVSITFDGIKNKTFIGKIIQADEFGINLQGVVNYNIFTSVEDGDNLIKPGMTANLSIETNKRENVLTIVNAAVRPYKGAKAVQILNKKGKPEYVTVTTGIKGIDRTEIITGAILGQKVIIGNTTKTVTP